MSFELSFLTGGICVVSTFGTIQHDDRLKIVDALRATNTLSEQACIVIDHSQARLVSTEQEAVEFVSHLVKFFEETPEPQFFVIPPQTNRSIIDTTVTKVAIAIGHKQLRVRDDIQHVIADEGLEKDRLQYQHQNYLKQFLSLEAKIRQLDLSEDDQAIANTTNSLIDQQMVIMHECARAEAYLIQDTLHKLQIWQEWKGAELQENFDIADALVQSTLKDLKEFFGNYRN